MRRRAIVALVIGVAAVLTVPGSNPPAAVADEVGVTSHLNPWSIEGALFARGAAGVAGVDIPGTCLSAYEEWEKEHTDEHTAAVDALRAQYWERRDANEAAVANGDGPIYDDVPPVTNISETAYLLMYLPMPLEVQSWLEQEWEPMDFARGTNIPCFGKGVLPAPPGGFIGIDLGDEPPDPDPCVVRGQLPFSPAVWTFYPSWHEKAPRVGGDGAPYSGIRSVYDATDGEIIFTFIPIVIGLQLTIECLAIFPNDEASREFEKLLPAAELSVVPEDVGVTGTDTKLWYDFEDPDNAIVGPITVGFPHRGTSWTLTAYAWVDAVGWDLDFDEATDGTPVWDESVDFPDTAWVPATEGEYAAMGGSLDEPARIHVYEQKDFYSIATGATWRGYYVVEEVGALGWGFSEQYDPVVRWSILPYQVDEIVGRRN